MGTLRGVLAWLLVPVVCLLALLGYAMRPFNPENNRLLGWVLARLGRRVLGMERPLEGAQNMPSDRPTVVIANHHPGQQERLDLPGRYPWQGPGPAALQERRLLRGGRRGRPHHHGGGQPLPSRHARPDRTSAACPGPHPASGRDQGSDQWRYSPPDGRVPPANARGPRRHGLLTPRRWACAAPINRAVSFWPSPARTTISRDLARRCTQ